MNAATLRLYAPLAATSLALCSLVIFLLEACIRQTAQGLRSNDVVLEHGAKTENILIALPALMAVTLGRQIQTAQVYVTQVTSVQLDQ